MRRIAGRNRCVLPAILLHQSLHQTGQSLRRSSIHKNRSSPIIIFVAALQYESQFSQQFVAAPGHNHCINGHGTTMYDVRRNFIVDVKIGHHCSARVVAQALTKRFEAGSNLLEGVGQFKAEKRHAQPFGWETWAASFQWIPRMHSNDGNRFATVLVERKTWDAQSCFHCKLGNLSSLWWLIIQLPLHIPAHHTDAPFEKWSIHDWCRHSHESIHGSHSDQRLYLDSDAGHLCWARKLENRILNRLQLDRERLQQALQSRSGLSFQFWNHMHRKVLASLQKPNKPTKQCRNRRP
mmetsp:Transcript_37004/g.89086  ORF Transcript_37004/g.89086 Transcript_37004/m.89086 type:complete len:294 (+) Transcript_37004:3147-4028(+)